jgi:hypothetical protein
LATGVCVSADATQVVDEKWSAATAAVANVKHGRRGNFLAAGFGPRSIFDGPLTRYSPIAARQTSRAVQLF